MWRTGSAGGKSAAAYFNHHLEKVKRIMFLMQYVELYSIKFVYLISTVTNIFIPLILQSF